MFLSKKIIHLDMDYFFAQVEIRDNPRLKGFPVAVGGSENGRGVICTCNYEARKLGVKSAMPSFQAKKLCPELIFIKPNFAKYSLASDIIFDIFNEYTDLVEGISLDEAYLDVTASENCLNSATLMAQQIRKKVYKETALTASTGISYNKLLAKIASQYNKPNGTLTLAPGQTEDFIKALPVEKMWGVGKVMRESLHQLNIYTFGQLQKYSKLDLINHFGNQGATLYDFCRGLDYRTVEKLRQRKSLSVENTFSEDITVIEEIRIKLYQIYAQMVERLTNFPLGSIKNIFVKIKYADFSSTTIESQFIGRLEFDQFFQLCLSKLVGNFKAIRLLGAGVKFYTNKAQGQLDLPLVL